MHSNNASFITFTSYLHYFIFTFIFECLIAFVLHFRRNLQSRALRTMWKKGKVVAFAKIEMTPLFTDTTCSREGGTSTWEAMYNILEEKPGIMETKVTVDGCDSSNASMLEIASSFLHRIAARQKIIPYTNMVKWVIDEADISDRQFRTRSQRVMIYFTPDNLWLMYHLLEPQVIYNRQFV